VIVADYAMRALADQSLGLKITNKVGTTTRFKSPAKYRIDLDFADDIMLVLDDAINSQKQPEFSRVGLKTEFIMVGNWASPIDLRVSTGAIHLVKDSKYSGSCC
jgi:hypothetical protein